MTGCTVWWGVPENLCGAPAVIRGGIRCLNGCIGEGDFDYACAHHEEWFRASREPDEYLVCRRCDGGKLELFPVTEIRD